MKHYEFFVHKKTLTSGGGLVRVKTRGNITWRSWLVSAFKAYSIQAGKQRTAIDIIEQGQYILHRAFVVMACCTWKLVLPFSFCMFYADEMTVFHRLQLPPVTRGSDIYLTAIGTVRIPVFCYIIQSKFFECSQLLQFLFILAKLHFQHFHLCYRSGGLIVFKLLR